MRSLPECDKLAALSRASGTEVLFQAKNGAGEIVSVDMTRLLAELIEAMRDLERLVDATNLTKAGGMGGLGKNSA